MNFSHQPPSQNFAEWLDIATRDLVPSAQARIRVEIEAHYAEAVQSQLANGAAESVAQTAALTDLGNAKSAARRFRRDHLTTKEALDVARMAKRILKAQSTLKKRPVISMLAMLYLLGVLAWGPFTNLSHALQHPSLFLIFLLAALSSTVLVRITFLIHRLQPDLAGVRQYLGFQLAGLPASSGLIFAAVLGLTRPYFVDVYMVLATVTVCACFFYYYFRLRWKLQSASASDLPDSDPKVA